MPPKKRPHQTRPTNPAKRPRLSRQEDTSRPFSQDQLMTVNITALSASISSAVKQAVVEALAERTQPSSGQSTPAPIAEQIVADAVGASLASITQGTPQSSVNDLTVSKIRHLWWPKIMPNNVDSIIANEALQQTSAPPCSPRLFV